MGTLRIYLNVEQRFDWDEKNIAHIARHRVAPGEVEELFDRERLTRRSKKVKGRFEAYGTTARRRYLVVIYEWQPGAVVRTITAYPMNPSTRKKYAPILKKLEKENLQKRDGRS